jgi:hypothetical protein
VPRTPHQQCVDGPRPVAVSKQYFESRFFMLVICRGAGLGRVHKCPAPLVSFFPVMAYVTSFSVEQTFPEIFGSQFGFLW